MCYTEDVRQQAARAICEFLRQQGHLALFAGGCVRDMLLGITPADYDIATSATSQEVMALFPKTFSVGAAFGVVRVVVSEGIFEVATFRKDGPYLDGRRPSSVQFCDAQEDARRRDFTINALFWDPHTNEVLDYVGGKEDLKNGILRTVGNPRQRFQEDHLRLMRAVRFAARLSYQIETNTWNAIQQFAYLIVHTSAERIRDELCKILTEGNAETGFRLLDASGLLKHILPEITAMKSVEQPPVYHPEGDVFEHTMLMLRHLDKPSITLAMGALLHDVGKPDTQTFEDRIRFNNHHKVGAEIAEAVCQRLRFSRKDTAHIVWLVDQHMRVADIPLMKENRRRRFVSETGFQELLELCRLDCLASHGDTKTIEWISDYRSKLKPQTTAPTPLLTGKDLIQLGFVPGPVFSEILNYIEEEQLEGYIDDKASAIQAVLARWSPYRNIDGK